MRHPFAIGCAAAAVMLSTVACGATKGAVPGAARPAAVRSAAHPATVSCPTRRAFATEVTSTGRIAWQVSLPTDAVMQGVVLQPLVIDGVGILAEENAVYGIRLRDGRELWRRAFSKQTGSFSSAVYGMWQLPNTVVVLIGQVSKDARLTELNPTTGTVGWTLKLPPSGLLGSQAQATGNTLAVLLPNGDLEAVNLVTGRVLWKRHVGQSAGPAAVGPVLASGGSSLAVGYVGRGDGRALWTARGLPPETNLTAAGGLFLAWSNVVGTGVPTAVTALNPRTGRVEWRFDPGMPVTILGAGQAGIAFATYQPARRLYLVNPANGRVRWSAATFAAAGNGLPGQIVVTASYVILVEANIAGSPGRYRLVARSAATGRVVWSVPVGAGADGGANLGLLPLAAGQAIAATVPDSSGLSTRLTVDRLATGRQLGSVALPDMVMAPLTITGTGVLAQSDSPACATPAVGQAVGHTVG